MQRFRFGLVVNPYAGIGGAVALKGSDGSDVRREALARGAEQKAAKRTKAALQELQDVAAQIDWLTAAKDMGADILAELGYSAQVCYQAEQAQTEAVDTQQAVTRLLEEGVDLLVFAGGDGTARDVYQAIGDNPTPVVGIPAGVKIHSGVYAITPKAAGRVLLQMVRGALTTLRAADVMDIDEAAFREGVVRARRFGELNVPGELEYMQAVKVGGQESDELVLADIAADVIEAMDDDALYIMGSGSTVAVIMDELGLANTLLGVDLVVAGELLASDVTAAELEATIKNYAQVYLVVTLIGGQGHVFGRGNQQLSPRVIRRVPRQNIIIVATKEKLTALAGRPLIVDTGDAELDRDLAGFVAVTTGYHDKTMVRIASID